MPKQVAFTYDGVDKSLLHRAVRESRQIAENLMNELYPGSPPTPSLNAHTPHTPPLALVIFPDID